MQKTKIPWAEYVWNPITGCSKISEGCKNCYAERIAKRFWGKRKFGDIQLRDKAFNCKFPKKPSIIFVNSMGDLFHKKIRKEYLKIILERIDCNPEHIFLILTKRSENIPYTYTTRINIWIGVTVENIKNLNRISELKEKHKGGRFVSFEPLLEDLRIIENLPGIDWVICGPETGSGKREFKLEWAKNIIAHSDMLSIPFFWKGNNGELPRQFPIFRL